ncbi:MAG TPA: OmpA family protein, partial [Burkholderiaceae bacterium]
GRGPVAQRASPTLRLAIIDLKTGAVVAETRVKVRADSIDNTPTPFFQDSPVLTGGAGDNTAPAPQLETLDAGALLDRGMAAYDNARYADALPYFEAAAKAPGADPMRVATGLYLTQGQLGRPELAKQAFGRIVEIGLQRRTLAVKFLFEPGKVEFWADPKVSGAYAMWLEQIAAGVKGRGICLVVVGHSSRTGTEAFNDQLSLQRAMRIGDSLRRIDPGLGLRLQENGKGYRENLIGSGTDDMRDALDRRVEFRFDGC